jgi:hypothetical protein
VIELRDFENGMCPGTIKGYSSNRKLIDRVQGYIDAKWLFEPDAEIASALIGWLWLTEEGREKAGYSMSKTDAQLIREWNDCHRVTGTSNNAAGIERAVQRQSEIEREQIDRMIKKPCVTGVTPRFHM